MNQGLGRDVVEHLYCKVVHCVCSGQAILFAVNFSAHVNTLFQHGKEGHCVLLSYDGLA